MRLRILDSGHGFATKALFSLIRAASRQPLLDVVKLVKYRPDFYGDPMQVFTQEAMRGASPWSVADRELMAALIAKTNRCDFCIKAHSAVATRAYANSQDVDHLISDPEHAQLREPLRSTLLLLRKLAREGTVTPDDVRATLAAGASHEQIEDALAVFFAFSVVTRLASAFAFADPGPDAFAAGAKYLLARGYR